MNRISIIAVILSSALLFSSQTVARAQDASDPKAWADGLFQTLLKKGETDFAAGLKDTMMGRETGGADVLLNAVTKTRQSFGDLTGYDYISQQQVGSRLRRLKYVTYNQRFFLVYQFAFYKSDRGWELFGADLNSQSSNVPWE